MLSEAMSGDVRPVSVLYEYWSFLVLRRVVSEVCEHRADNPGDLIALSASGFELRLRRGSKSRCNFNFTGSNGRELKVTLFYNRPFPRPKDSSHGWEGSYSSTFHPDFSLLVRLPNERKSHWIHFDAKYRATSQSIRDAFDDHEETFSDAATADDQLYAHEIRRTHTRDDLFKMHTYRDGILGSRGAFILYPGDDVESDALFNYLRHPVAFDGHVDALPSVGAFPLTPRGSCMQLSGLRDFVRRTLEALASFSSYEEERGFR
jgi:uncharacterized protein